MFAFLLFLTLGLTVFVPLSGQARIVALVVFAILMVLWLLGGLGVLTMPYGGGQWK